MRPIDHEEQMEQLDCRLLLQRTTVPPEQQTLADPAQVAFKHVPEMKHAENTQAKSKRSASRPLQLRQPICPGQEHQVAAAVTSRTITSTGRTLRSLRSFSELSAQKSALRGRRKAENQAWPDGIAVYGPLSELWERR